jgi:hypothetical protein
VYTPIAHQPNQVKRLSVISGVTDRFQQLVIGRKTMITDGDVYALKFLINNASGTQIKVADFRVSHLSVG